MGQADNHLQQRVEAIINCPTFRKELEDVIRHQQAQGDAAALLALQQHIARAVGVETQRLVGTIPRTVIPIDDIGDVEPAGYVPGEKELRCKLAALYRLMDHFGWTQAVFNHITARVPGDHDHFLLNPFGLLYHEITASSLVKVDIQGKIVHGGSTHFGVNIAGFILHSAVHAARKDARFVVHIHHPACVAVSAMKCGFLTVSQESVTLGNVSYHDFYGILIDEAEREIIAKNFGPVNRQMVLRNHGVVAIGSTVEEAFTRIFHLVLACESQVRMMSVGLDNLIIISEEAKMRSLEVVRKAAEFMSKGKLAEKSAEGAADQDKSPDITWNIGDIEYEAYMRMLDAAGYRTGYSYRLPSYQRTQRQ